MKLRISHVLVRNEQYLSPGDDLADLTDSIRKDGMNLPILVDADNCVIDGYRRLQAAMLLGWEEVEVVQPLDYDEVCRHLFNANVECTDFAEPYTPRRVYAVIRGVQPYIDQRVHQAKKAYKGTPRKGPKVKVRATPVRRMLRDALGVPSEGYLQAVVRVFDQARLPGPYQELAKRARDQVVFDGRSVYSVHNELHEQIKQHARMIMDKEGQARILANSVPLLRNIINALGQVGEIHADVDRSDAQEWKGALTEYRKALHLAQMKLDRHLNGPRIKNRNKSTDN
jgi:hypothetical protein